MIGQICSSKNTSVNATVLPSVYSLIDWKKLKAHISAKPPVVLDYGCGRHTEHIEQFLNAQGFSYYGYDPYWLPNKSLPAKCDVVICSNVLNVIDSYLVQSQIQQKIRSYQVPFFIKVYEGDRSTIGRKTKDDCYQCNQPTDYYLYNYGDEIKRKVITRVDYLPFIV